MRLLVILVAAFTIAVLLPYGSADATTACHLKALQASFRVVPGSAGAGNIVYRLRLENSSVTACIFHDPTSARLLGVNGHGLPTQASFAAVARRVAPGHAIRADVRFSPDVPGVGEQMRGPCEHRAYTLALYQGRVRLLVPVQPATPVCERGRLDFSAWR
jgi:hypothetical protein